LTLQLLNPLHQSLDTESGDGHDSKPSAVSNRLCALQQAFWEYHSMTLNAFAFLCLTALFTAVSNLLVRSSLARVADLSLSRAGVLNLIREPMFLAAGLLFTTATLMWFRAVSRNSISTVYPLYVGLTFFFVMLGAFYFLGERISLYKLASAALILLGVFVGTRG
jgi:drug/metabolite transporter (DMT)-like permease